MKIALALSALSAVAATQADNGVLIIGGKEAAVGQHLYVTGLRETDTGYTMCGGSLIAPNVILTAAHCMDHGFKYAALGSHYLNGNKDGEIVRVKQEIKHPKYNPAVSTAFDFAVVILERDSKYPTVEVSFDEVAGGTPTVVRGWGTTSSGGSQSSVLLELGVNAFTNEQCSKSLGGMAIDGSMLCAGGVAGEDSCQGDSGGPLTVEADGNPAKLVGIVSWGDGCAQAGKPGVYSRISAARDFIEPYIKSSPTVSPAPSTSRPTTSKPGTTAPTTKAPSTTLKPTTARPLTPRPTTPKPTTRQPGCASCNSCYFPNADWCLSDFSKDDCTYFGADYGTVWCGN